MCKETLVQATYKFSYCRKLKKDITVTHITSCISSVRLKFTSVIYRFICVQFSNTSCAYTEKNLLSKLPKMSLK